MKDIENSKVTVGIVVYNTSLDVLRNTLNSLKTSTISIQVLVLCNSNSEQYQKLVESLCLEYGFGLLKNMPNRGFGAGHNEIWKRATTVWYICCNPDIRIHPDAIEKLVEYGEKNARSGLLMPKVLNIDGSIQPLARQHPTPWRWILRQLWRIFPNLVQPYELKFDYDKTQRIEFVTGCFFAVKVQTMALLGGFDEEFFLYAEDADLSKRADMIANNYYVSTASVFHVWSTKWFSNPRAVYFELISLFRYFFKFRKID